MEEQDRTELQLSEEHLQEITGGCALCEADGILATYHQQQAGRHMVLADGLAQRAQQQGLTDAQRGVLQHVATHLNSIAGANLQLSQALINRIATRGHR